MQLLFPDLSSISLILCMRENVKHSFMLVELSKCLVCYDGSLGLSCARFERYTVEDRKTAVAAAVM
jgi:hypothetical protein